MLRWWLIDGPAWIVTIWFLAYRWLLIVSTIITVSIVVSMLVASLLGLRWGW